MFCKAFNNFCTVIFQDLFSVIIFNIVFVHSIKTSINIKEKLCKQFLVLNKIIEQKIICKLLINMKNISF